jgi:CHAT domain-containing protein
MLSLDGRLRYVPMAALHDGKAYLAERYALAIFTEAARDKLKDRRQADWKIVGLGLTEAKPGFNPLPAVADELEAIIRRSEGDEGVMSGVIRLNHEFTAESLFETLDLRYPVLHIASHFVFQPSTDQDSFLLLGDGGKLSLADIRLAYNFQTLDLLTLSACQTAVGSATKGREVEGFGVLAQKQGAKSVIATLWPVDDHSTGLFMANFYRVQANQATKAGALQQTQQAFLGVGQAQPPYVVEYRHPYYWAPFILMGNWL